MPRTRTHVVGRMLLRGGESKDKAVKILSKMAGEYDGDRAKIAEQLGISATTLWRWLKIAELDLDAAALEYMAQIPADYPACPRCSNQLNSVGRCEPCDARQGGTDG